MKIILLIVIAVLVGGSVARAETEIWQTFTVRANGSIGASKLAPKPRSHSFESNFGGKVYRNEVKGYQDITETYNYDNTKTIVVHTYSITTKYAYKVDNRRIPVMVDDPRGAKPSYKSGYIPMKPVLPRFKK